MKRTISLIVALLIAAAIIPVFAVTSSAADAFPFRDVAKTRWSRDVISYAWNKEYMNGVGTNTFDPTGTMTRAMAVTVLYRIDGSPAVTGRTKFTDVPVGKWYSDAITWAYTFGIVNGVTSARFAPDQFVTREQLVSILFRYAAYRGDDVTPRGSLDDFRDRGKVSNFAVYSFMWAVGEGLVNGITADTLAPKGNATREQFAAILFRFDTLGSDDVIRVINDKIYKLTFEDEFDGDELDTTKWKLSPDGVGTWDDDMVTVEDGRLKLSAGKEGDRLVSGGVRTLGRFEQCRGYFEASMKLQSAPGFWGAFWMYGGNMENDTPVVEGAIDGCEIDVVESFDAVGKKINHAIHWDGYVENHKSVNINRSVPAYYDGFHTFAVEWTDTEYTFYVDGKYSWMATKPGPCEVPLYLLFTTEIGTWAGELDESLLPDGIEVEYVRAYQLAE